MKRITFVQPYIGAMRSSDAMEPLVLAVLASRTPPDIELKLYDDHVEDIPYDEPTDLVAMSVDTFSARRAYQLADKYMARGIPVVMGGHHPTLLPDEAIEHCNSVVQGDAEGVWEELVEDARHGRLRNFYKGESREVLTGPLPDRKIFENKRYLPISSVQYGRGCRYSCDFCSVNAFYGKRLVQHSIPDIVNEIKSLKHKLVLFVDDNIFSDLRHAENLFRAIKPLGIRWVCQSSIDIARNKTLVPLMAESGCIAALVGLESLRKENLKQMNKSWNMNKHDYTTAIQKFHDHGIMVYGTFVFGYDYDSLEDIDVSVEFALRNGLFLVNFNPLTPTPGTALYERLEAEGRLLYDRWWIAPDYQYGHAVFKPRGMSPSELTEGCYQAKKKFYSYPSMLRRLINAPRFILSPYMMAVYLTSNWVCRREVLRKQNKSLLGPDNTTPVVRHT